MPDQVNSGLPRAYTTPQTRSFKWTLHLSKRCFPRERNTCESHCGAGVLVSTQWFTLCAFLAAVHQCSVWLRGFGARGGCLGQCDSSAHVGTAQTVVRRPSQLPGWNPPQHRSLSLTSCFLSRLAAADGKEGLVACSLRVLVVLVTLSLSGRSAARLLGVSSRVPGSSAAPE